MTTMITTDEERVAALQRFGYSPRESAFLCLAALHGGYFLRRQYGTFLGREDGGCVAQLIEKTLDLGHANATTFRHKTQIYHLSSRPFYARIGQENNRNRRAKEPLSIKNRLMGLDFVLAHREFRYLATQSEKLAFFADQVKISLSDLPAKLYRPANAAIAAASYFVDKYPIFLSVETASDVSFCFVDEGMATMSRFETYLSQYGKTFSALPAFSLVYVAASENHFGRAKELFERTLSGKAVNSAAERNREKAAHLAAYFRLRRSYEAKEFASLDRAQLIQLRNSREEFSGSEIDALYARWTIEGDAVLPMNRQLQPPALRKRNGRFSTYLLPYSYEFFEQISTL
jgi:hypothetical protein